METAKFGAVFDSNVSRIFAASVVGGTASQLGGGKFANGALSAAFVSMFSNFRNETSSSGVESVIEELQDGVEIGELEFQYADGDDSEGTWRTISKTRVLQSQWEKMDEYTQLNALDLEVGAFFGKAVTIVGTWDRVLVLRMKSTGEVFRFAIEGGTFTSRSEDYVGAFLSLGESHTIIQGPPAMAEGWSIVNKAGVGIYSNAIDIIGASYGIGFGGGKSLYKVHTTLNYTKKLDETHAFNAF